MFYKKKFTPLVYRHKALFAPGIYPKKCQKNQSHIITFLFYPKNLLEKTNLKIAILIDSLGNLTCSFKQKARKQIWFKK